MKIGIDMGGSHIGIGLVNDEGKIIQKQETDLNINTPQIINFIQNYLIENIKQMLKQNDVNFIGVASPRNAKTGKNYNYG